MCSEKGSLLEAVFVRWIQHVQNEKVADLYDYLADGIHLVYFVEKLSLHEFKAKIKNPSFRTQKMENVTFVLRYLRENECIKFLDIDSSNILNKEVKIVLGFLWHIFEHFSIVKPLDAFFASQDKKSPGRSTKQKLMNWLKYRVSMTVKNLTFDCQDGRIIGALVNSYNGNLCDDWITWHKNTSYTNVNRSLEEASNELNIARLITTEELINGEVDEKSMMAYLSQFITCTSRFGSDKLPQDNHNQCPDVIKVSPYSTVSIEGDIHDPEPLSSKADDIFIIPDKRLSGSLNVSAKQSWCINTGAQTSIISKGLPDKGCSDLSHLDQIDLENFLNIKGRGIQEKGLRSGDHLTFSIEELCNPYFGIKDVMVKIKSPKGSSLDLRSTYGADTLMCSYSPKMIGLYEIYILIPRLKFQKLCLVNIDSKCLNQIVAFGPGLMSGSPGHVAVFMVDTNGETGTLNFTIEGPNEAEIQCKDNEDGSATVEYWPTAPGEYAVHILYKGSDIKDSPFMVDIKERQSRLSPMDVKAYGPALCEDRVKIHETAQFTVDVSKVNKVLDPISVECFNRYGEIMSFDIVKEEDFKRTYSFTPLSSDPLTLWISYDNISIYGSPFKIRVSEDSLASQIVVYGSGLESSYCGEEAVFFIDCRAVKVEGRLKVIITDNQLKAIPCFIDRRSKDLKIYSVRYVPARSMARCFIDIIYDDVPVYEKPFVAVVIKHSEDDPLHSREEKNHILKINRMISDQNKSNIESTLSLPDYSDIFLDTRSESFLKIVAPPESPLGSDLPLPPPDLIDESGDTPFDHLPSKFPLSTVLEESEDNYSVKDSIFSSESHSRASAKDDFVSLSRKSSFTLPPRSPGSICPQIEISGDYGCVRLPRFIEDPPKSISILPLKLEKGVDTDLEDVFNDAFPLPEPPSELKLLSLSSNVPSVLKCAHLSRTTQKLEECILMDLFCRTSSLIMMADEVCAHLVLGILDYMYLLSMATCIISTTYSCKYELTETIILSNYYNKPKHDKIESQIVPVIFMEPILSPYEGLSNSDNSDCSLASEHKSVVILLQSKIRRSSPRDFNPDMNSIHQIVPEEAVFVAEQYLPLLKVLKEVTTSEVSEISETSQWISNDERLLPNHAFEMEEDSMKNSLSDIARSVVWDTDGWDNPECAIDSVPPFYNTNNCKHVQQFCCTSLHRSRSDVNTIIRNDLSRISYKHVSWENEDSFPEPPSDLAMSRDHDFGDDTRKETNRWMTDRSKYMSQLPEAVLTTCTVDQVCTNTINVSMNEPVLNYPVICIIQKSNYPTNDTKVSSHKNFEITKCASKQKKNDGTSDKSNADSLNDDISIQSQTNVRNLSCESIFLDLGNCSQSHRTMVYNKRRSLSQSHSYQNHPSKDVAAYFRDNSLSDAEYSNKSHNRTQSESDNNKMDLYSQLDENAPTKLEKNKELKIIPARKFDNESKRRNSPQINSIHVSDVESKKVPSNTCDIHKNIPYSNIGGSQSLILDEKETKSIFVFGSGLNNAICRKVAEFTICTNGKGTEGISLAIEGPSETEIEIMNLSNGNCKVKYITMLPGEYLLTIQQNGLQIHGSPFRISALSHNSLNMDAQSVLPNQKVYAVGQGLSEAYTNFPNQFTINSKDSGPGGLSLSIEGPSKAYIEFQDSKNGICGVTYKVVEPGIYTCIVKFNKSHIRDSPFSINVQNQKTIPQLNRYNKSFHENEKNAFQVGKKALFKTTYTNLDISKIVAVLYCPNETKKELVVKCDRERNIIWVEFIPWVEGSHKLLFLDESHEEINSFHFMVEECKIVDIVSFERELNSIKVYGKGLVKGKAGSSNIFTIEIGESVSGALNVTVDGPSKVEIKCTETDKGFRFSYIPNTPGDYLVTIKYGGEQQIKGSPFQVKINGPNKTQNCKKKITSASLPESLTNLYNDNNTITCYGSGLYSGKIHLWMDFYVDASNSKIIDYLFVGILGPKEPCQEIRITYVERKRYLISYKARESGNHTCFIKWGGNAVSGSPWTIPVEN